MRLACGRSSQFASALMLIAPRLAGGLEIEIAPPAVSLPYLDLTAAVLRDFGGKVERRAELRWRVAAGGLVGREYRIEGDHSSAGYALAAAAVLGGRVRVDNLRPGSTQPDARLGSILRDLGCRVESGSDWVEACGSGRIRGLDVDLGDAPDLAPTLAILALFAEGPSVLRGLAHLRHKESDRLGLLARNLTRLGRDARIDGDRLLVGQAPPRLTGARIATDSDHRLAMAFAVAGLRVAGIEIEQPECVAKSNPAFWEQFERLEGGRLRTGTRPRSAPS